MKKIKVSISSRFCLKKKKSNRISTVKFTILWSSITRLKFAVTNKDRKDFYSNINFENVINHFFIRLFTILVKVTLPHITLAVLYVIVEEEKNKIKFISDATFYS